MYFDMGSIKQAMQSLFFSWYTTGLSRTQHNILQTDFSEPILPIKICVYYFYDDEIGWWVYPF